MNEFKPIKDEGNGSTVEGLSSYRESTGSISGIPILSSLTSAPYHVVTSILVGIIVVVSSFVISISIPVAALVFISATYTLAIHSYRHASTKSDMSPISLRYERAMYVSIIGGIVALLLLVLGTSGTLTGLAALGIVLATNNFLFRTYLQDSKKFVLNPSKLWLYSTRVPMIAVLAGLVLGLTGVSELVLLALGTSVITFTYTLLREGKSPSYSNDMKNPKKLENQYKNGRKFARKINDKASTINNSLDRVGCEYELTTFPPRNAPYLEDVLEFEEELQELNNILYQQYGDNKRLIEDVRDLQHTVDRLKENVYADE